MCYSVYLHCAVLMICWPLALPYLHLCHSHTRLLFFLREPHAGGGSFALLLCGATAWRGGAWRPCGRRGQAPGHLRLRS